MFTLNCKGKLVSIDNPIIMGIINVTADSFYSGSRASTVEAALEKASRMLANGADILDIGGQSTRPGSRVIPPDEELAHTIPVIKAIHQRYPEAILSIDTYYGIVARAAIQAGACIVNDISAGTMDSTLINTVAELRVPYVLMHMQGTPQNMQQNPAYENVTKEVLDFFIQKIELLKQKGIHDIIIDPGIGFGKTISHNFELIRNLSVFRMVECPILLGISRKGTIYKTLGVSAEEALNGTTVLNTIGLLNGANILRVHDVKEAKEAATLVNTYLSTHRSFTN